MKIFKYTKESNKQAHTHHLCFMIVYRVPYLIYVYFANYCKLGMWTSLVVHWLRLCVPDTGGLGSISGEGTGSHIMQLKILNATTKTWCNQVNK